MMGGIRASAGDLLVLNSASSIALFLEAHVVIMEDSGQHNNYSLVQITTTDRTLATLSSVRISRDGWVVNAVVRERDGALTTRRGQCYAALGFAAAPGEARGTFCSGYVYSAHAIPLGELIELTDGKGFLNWVQEANDAAGNATTTVNLAVTNARRMIRAVIVKVHSSSDVATRTWTITLRDLADSGGPTGWSIASDTWVSPTLTLTADEEGLMHLGEHGFMSVNDAGTLAYADNSSSPNPFPMMVEEGDSVDLVIAAGAGEAADDYDVWVQYEEWIEL